MAAYRVIITAEAMKGVDSIGRRTDRARVMERIHKLADNPRPHGSQKLTGPLGGYRVRQGDYRVIYDIRDEILIVTVVNVGHRKDIYRRGRA